jgi:hypothetical protein
MAGWITGLIAAVAIAGATQAGAAACDYTMSKLAGKTLAAVKGSDAGAELQSAGYYTLVHGGSGLKILGSSTAGASIATGLVSGASGLLGSVGAIAMAPATLVIGGIAIVGVGSFEGYCYFQVQRITDPYEVRKIVESVAENDEAVSIVATDDGDAMALQIDGETKTYLLRNLYIADGQLKHRDFGLNTNLGPVAFTSKELPAVEN